MKRPVRRPRIGIAAMVVVLAASWLHADVRELWDLEAIRKDPLDVKVIKEEPGLDLAFPHRKLHLTYLSQKWQGQDVRIEAFVVIPLKPKDQPSDKIPAVLSLHGHGGAGSMGDAVGKAKEFKGVGMSISGPGQGLSTGRRDATAHWIDADKDVRNSFMYQYPYAAMRAITYLTQLKQVDPKRIGVMGGSMGAMCTLIVNGVDSRVAAAVPVSGCGSHEPEMAAGKTWFSRLILDALDVKMDNPGLQAYLKNLDEINYAPYQHGPCFLVCGAQDEPFPITCMARTFAKMPDSCRMFLVYDHNHGGFTKPDDKFTMYDNRAQWGRRVFGSLNWWLHHYLDAPKPGQPRSPVPKTPKLSLKVGKENEVAFTLDVDTALPVQRVLLCWSLDGSYTFHKAVMTKTSGSAYGLSVVLHQAERDVLCAYVEVEYPDDFFLSCMPHFGPKFDVKVRRTEFPLELYRREMSAEQAMAAFKKEIDDASKPLGERLWKQHAMGKYLRSVKEYDRAIQAFDDLIKRGEGKTKDTLVPTALYWKALVLNDLGRYKEAIACLERAIELYPKCDDLSGDEIPRAKKLLNEARYAQRKQP
ncbi:MAG: acetylxylan esterase [Phycisphaerae bacterium]|nr:acetylxylan esterase [Phycisphaerae bacterium]